MVDLRSVLKQQVNMSFAIPWGLLALIAVPVIIGIYLLRRHFRPKVVSALFLWMAPGMHSGGGRKISRLERSILLLIEILMAILLALAVAAPGCRRQGTITNIAVILDDTASMSVSENGERFILKQAKSAILDFLDSNRPFYCTLVLTGPSPKLLTTISDNITDIKNALEQWNPQQPYHDVSPAFKIARQVFGKNGKGTILFITDKAPPSENGKFTVPESVIWRAFGKKIPNSAITSAGRTVQTAEDKENIFAIIEHYGEGEVEIPISIMAGDKLISEQKLRISHEPGQGKDFSRKKILIEPPKLIEDPIYIRILKDDALQLDNTVMLLPENSKPIRIMSDFSDAKLKDIFSDTIAALANECKISEENPDIVFTDSAQLIAECRQKNPRAWVVYFVPPETASRKVFYGPYIIDKKSPVCDGVYLSGVRWAATEGKTDKEMMPLITVGEFALLGEENVLSEYDSRKFVINFVPESSNLQKTPAFPIIVSNIIRLKRNSRSGFLEKNFRSGEKISGRFPDALGVEVSKVKVQKDGSEKSELVISHKSEIPERNFVLEFSSQLPGLFKVSEKTATGQNTDRLSCNFLCADESDLNSSVSGEWKEKKGIETVTNPYWKDESWIFLLLAISLFFQHVYLVKRKEFALEH